MPSTFACSGSWLAKTTLPSSSVASKSLFRRDRFLDLKSDLASSLPRVLVGETFSVERGPGFVNTEKDSSFRDDDKVNVGGGNANPMILCLEQDRFLVEPLKYRSTRIEEIIGDFWSNHWILAVLEALFSLEPILR